jgi:hypothetical protein
MWVLRSFFCVAVSAMLLGARASGPGPAGAPAATSEEGLIVYTNDAFLNLVRKYSTDSGESVDYAAWKLSPEDLAALQEQIDLIAAISPGSDPDQFRGRASQRSYWINSYNALVLHAVLEYWPLDSVRDVEISFTSRLVPGKGFFYDRKVVVGGQTTSLYQLEKEVLASQKDPRLHFALNCASESCPVLRPWEWSEEQLDEAAREFVNKAENVSVQDGELLVSTIFKWYKRDFPRDLNGYLQQYAEPDLLRQLRLAQEQSYPTRYREYDWSLNAEPEAGAESADSP